MTFSDQLMKQLLATFTQEAHEHLETMNRLLLTIERRTNVAGAEQAWADIFRAAHSLKGAARAVGKEPIGRLAHQIESLFGRIKSGGASATPAFFDLSYEALDAIQALVDAIGSGSQPSLDLNNLALRIENFSSADQAEQRPPSISPPASLAPLAVVSAAPDAEPPLAAETTADIGDGSLGTVREESVRVVISKLDAVLNQVGELQAARLGSAQRLAELQAALLALETWEAEWRKLRPQALANAPAHSTDAAEAAQSLRSYLTAHDAHLRQAVTALSDLRRRLQADNRRMAQLLQGLENQVRHTRMLPVATALGAFPRMVRDLARESHKQVNLVIEGADAEVDRTLLEQIKDPLTHLLRNAVDHGIEPPTQRQAANKPAAGTITLTTAQRGDRVLLTVTDDGRGIVPQIVRDAAIRRGILTAAQAANLDSQGMIGLIFRPGFSTADQVSQLSGRGVGLDVVRRNVEHLGGLIEVESQAGRGTRFQIQLPLTLATTLCLLVQCSGQTFGIPVANVTRIVRAVADQLRPIEGRPALVMDGQPLAINRLSDMLDLPPTATGRAAAPHMPIVVLGLAERQLGLHVDALLGVQEIIAKSLPRPFLHVRHVAGAAILGNGEVILTLDAADLLRGGHSRPATTAGAPAQPTHEPPLIVVADDSFTTRTLEKNILEAAGYRVRTAADGMEAWSLLQSEHPALLVSDVNMPHMDGFELAATVRKDERLRHLPVILVTSLDSPADRARGVEAGADAYLVKSTFSEESLLAAIRKLI